MEDQNYSWTDERVELLKKLWGEGLSASQIAAELCGVTRNAVIGKAQRLGINAQHKRKATLDEKAAPKKPRRTTNPLGNKLHKKAEPAPPLASSGYDADTFQTPETYAPVTLQTLESGCAWPLGDPQSSSFTYCGAKRKLGKSYCPYHMGIAYTPPQARKPKAVKSGNMNMQSSWYAS